MDILSQLMPCPFCGSKMILVVDFSIHCHCCNAKGPSGYSVEQAIILWNKRVPKNELAAQRGKTDDKPNS
ncbi:MAG: hypothetical protein C4586_05120 [Anaerolineaceae bacterium]|nr:MAG: hypothetical protein C4586_05120 [Anaerolineaceae bacterium]